MLQTVSPKHARRIARNGARHLATMIKPDGRFIYSYQPGPPLRISQSYNVLRHCGSVWSMFDTLRLTGPDAAVSEAATRAGRYILDQFVKPYGSGDQMCVIDGEKIKLGGSGLALLALTSLSEAENDPKVLDIARAIGRYILDQRIQDGDFVHSRSFPSGEILAFRSNYYTGEAVFGLLTLARATAESVWGDAAFNSLRLLGAQNYGVAERHHWMLYALDLAHQMEPSEELRDYARRIADGMTDNSAYRLDGRSTPSACMSEGLLAYLRIEDRLGAYDAAERYRQSVLENFEVQLRSLRPTGAFMRGGGKSDVRIDFIQHNISAFAAWHVLAGGREAEASVAEQAAAG